MTPSRPFLHPTVLRMAGAHLAVDAYGNVYAPLLPLLIPKLGMSLAMAGAFAMLFQLAASFAQLGFGHIADRWRPRLLLTVGPFVAVSLLSLVGIATTKPELALILIAGGLGTAAFHPPAAALAHRLGGRRAGTTMSVYITGGTIGVAVGPLLFAPFVGRFGLPWTPLLAVPGLVVVAAFALNVPRFDLNAGVPAAGLSALRPYAAPLALLYGIVSLRTLTSLARPFGVTVTPVAPPKPSPPSPLTPEVLGAIERTTAELWPTVKVVPVMSTGATDGLYLRKAGIPVYGVSGIFDDMDDVRAHGQDERMKPEWFFDGQEFMYRLVRKLAGPTQP